MAETQRRWYDSRWLAAYHGAKKVLRSTAPDRLEDFVRAFDILRTPSDFAPGHFPGVIAPELLEELRETVRAIPRESYELHEIKAMGRFVVHDWPRFSALQHSLTDSVSEWAGQAVEPCYNFLSLYTRLGVCEPHLDAPLAKWTLDICLNQSEPWPIHFSQIVPWPEEPRQLSEDWREAIVGDPALQFRSLAMQPGDAILFSGSSQWHYREPLPRDGGKHFCDLLFLHYIPKGTAELVIPANWPRLFDLPQLAAVPNLDLAA